MHVPRPIQRPATKLHPPPRRVPRARFQRRGIWNTSPTPQWPNSLRSDRRPKSPLSRTLPPSRHRARTRLLRLHTEPHRHTNTRVRSRKSHLRFRADERLVHQHETEDVIFGFGHGYWCAYGVRCADEAAEFELDVETAAGCERGDFWVGGRI